jgi:hypothetical protein
LPSLFLLFAFVFGFDLADASLTHVREQEDGYLDDGRGREDRAFLKLQREVNGIRGRPDD